MIMLKDKRGFTILETLISLAVFALISLSAVNILSFAYTSNGRAVVNNELFEQGKATIDFITAHVNRSCEINLTTDELGTLKEMKLAHMESQGVSESYTKVWQSILYNKNLRPEDTTYHKVRFGQVTRSNELSSYIADIKVKIEGKVMEIEIVTDDKVRYNDTHIVAPVHLKAKISLEHKEYTVIIKD